MKTVVFDDLELEEQELLLEAQSACGTAYSPYSNFMVGAALRSKSGVIITGSNVENAAYGSSICAERAALLSANAQKIRDITALACVAQREDGGQTRVAAPCGACRQMIHEASSLAGNNIQVILANNDLSEVARTTSTELLPFAFTAVNLQ